jgi:hypothetical protein
MGAEHPDGLARLHEQGLVAFEVAERADDAVEAVPVPRGPADAAVHHELLRAFGDFGIEVVHQHPERRLGEPAFRRELGAAGAADGAGVVEAGEGGHGGGCPVEG